MLNQKDSSADGRNNEKNPAINDHSPHPEPHFINDVQPHHHQLRQEWRIYTMAVNACLGSWFFGYNLGVYSSAQTVISKINSWDSDTSDDNAALVTAFMPLGALIGALISRQVIDYINGIRKSMMIFDIIGIIGTIILIVDSTLENLLIGRLICGLCIGCNTAVIPVYIREFSPVEISGRTGAVNQYFLTLGVFSSYLSGLIIPFPSNIKNGYDNEVDWRIQLGLPMISPIIRFLLLVMVFKLETPTILMKAHKYEEVHNFINKIYSSEKDAEEVYHDLEEKVNNEVSGKQHGKKLVDEKRQSNEGHIQHNELTSNKNTEQEQININPGAGSGQGSGNQMNIQLATLPHETQQNQLSMTHFKSRDDFYHEKLFEISNRVSYLSRFVLGCAIQFGTQCSGVDAILFYSNTIFKETAGGVGLHAEKTGRYASIGLGGAMNVFTMLSFYLLGKVGRRPMFIFGVGLCVVTDFVFAGLNKATQTSSVQDFSIFLIFLFQFGWQLSLGAVTWVYNSEISDRFSISVSSFVRWTSTMIVGLVFPEMRKSIQLFGAFIIFGCLTAAVYLVYLYLMKETKGKDRYQIAEAFINPSTYVKIKQEAAAFADKSFEEQKQSMSN